jgi:hypothetical protein
VIGLRTATHVLRSYGSRSEMWGVKKTLACLMVVGSMSFLTFTGVFAQMTSETSNHGLSVATGTLTFNNTVGVGTPCDAHKQFSSTLSTALTNGAAVTSVSIAALTGAVRSGDSVVISSGANTQTFVASAAANAGATSITVTSQNANFSYPIGSIVAPLANINTNCTALFTSSTLSYPGTPQTVQVTIKNTGSVNARDLAVYMPSCTRVASPGAPTQPASTFNTTLTTALTNGAATTTLPVSALSGSIASGASVVISSGTHTQTFVASAAASANATSISVTSQNANFAYPIGSGITNVGGSTGGTFSTTLSSGLTSGSAVTSLATAALTGSIIAGDSIVITSGANTQTFIALSSATAGATSLSVVSQNANFSYATGSTVTNASNDPCANGGGQFFIQETDSSFANPTCIVPTPGAGACTPTADSLADFASTYNTSISSWDFGAGPAAGASRYFVVGLQLPASAASALQAQAALFSVTWRAST